MFNTRPSSLDNGWPRSIRAASAPANTRAKKRPLSDDSTEHEHTIDLHRDDTDKAADIMEKVYEMGTANDEYDDLDDRMDLEDPILNEMDYYRRRTKQSLLYELEQDFPRHESPIWANDQWVGSFKSEDKLTSKHWRASFLLINRDMYDLLERHIDQAFRALCPDGRFGANWEGIQRPKGIESVLRNVEPAWIDWLKIPKENTAEKIRDFFRQIVLDQNATNMENTGGMQPRKKLKTGTGWVGLGVPQPSFATTPPRAGLVHPHTSSHLPSRAVSSHDTDWGNLMVKTLCFTREGDIAPCKIDVALCIESLDEFTTKHVSHRNVIQKLTQSFLFDEEREDIRFTMGDDCHTFHARPLDTDFFHFGCCIQLAHVLGETTAFFSIQPKK